jgi:hypothetical protein
MKRYLFYEKIKDLNKVKFIITKLKGPAYIWCDYVQCKIMHLNKVKFIITKLKGHAYIWCDFVQCKIMHLNKEKIRTWGKMVSKLRENSIPINYK